MTWVNAQWPIQPIDLWPIPCSAPLISSLGYTLSHALLIIIKILSLLKALSATNDSQEQSTSDYVSKPLRPTEVHMNENLEWSAEKHNK